MCTYVREVYVYDSLGYSVVHVSLCCFVLITNGI